MEGLVSFSQELYQVGVKSCWPRKRLVLSTSCYTRFHEILSGIAKAGIKAGTKKSCSYNHYKRTERALQNAIVCILLVRPMSTQLTSSRFSSSASVLRFTGTKHNIVQSGFAVCVFYASWLDQTSQVCEDAKNAFWIMHVSYRYCTYSNPSKRFVLWWLLVLWSIVLARCLVSQDKAHNQKNYMPI